MTRRGFLLLAGLAGIAWLAPRALALLPASPPDTRPLPGLPGFRAMAGGPSSGPASPALLGLDAPEAAPAADACAGLFSAGAGGGLPLALFTDFRCPECRVLERALDDWSGPPIALTRHELPILGPASEAAARAALAAGRQGAREAMTARLKRSAALPDPTWLTGTAEGLGLDPGRLLDDLAAPEVEAALARSRALAARLGIAATPGMVVGGTIVVGRPRTRILAALVAAESRRPLPCAPGG